MLLIFLVLLLSFFFYYYFSGPKKIIIIFILELQIFQLTQKFRWVSEVGIFTYLFFSEKINGIVENLFRGRGGGNLDEGVSRGGIEGRRLVLEKKLDGKE